MDRQFAFALSGSDLQATVLHRRHGHKNFGIGGGPRVSPEEDKRNQQQGVERKSPAQHHETSMFAFSV
jgi:hypothetical protein